MARPRSDIAQRIVTAAAERFLHDGVDGASLRQIAVAAGTNLGMVYYYFPTKDDLFLAVVERHYAPLSQAIIEAIAAGPSFDERVRALYDRFGAMSDEEFVVLRLVLREALVSSERLTRVFERMMHGHTPAMLELLSEGIATGRVAADLHPVAALVTMAVLAIAPQVMVRRVAASVKAVELPTASELARHLSTVALRGIGPAVSGEGPGQGSPAPPEASPPTASGRRSAARRRPR
jgi:AcrR family transcriptional regulator